jgi:putative hydrolase of the HAD superfamily
MDRKELTGYRVIIFDLGKVLLDFDHRRISNALAGISPRCAEDIHNYIFSTELVRLFDRGRITPETFYQTLKTRFLIRVSFQEFASLWNEIFTVIEGMEELLFSLRKNYTIALHSNTNKLHFEYVLHHFKLLGYFNHFHLSYELNLLKPDPEIFKRVIEFHRIAPEQIIFTDDIVENVAAASAAGIDAIPFRSAADLHVELLKRGVALNDALRS